jgi:hypothetical protein
VVVDVAVKSTGKGAEQDSKVEKEALDRAVQRVTALGTGAGYVSAMEGQGMTMSITLRVPAGTYQDVMSQIAAIGTVSSLHETTDDVTARLIDLDSRTKTMKASVDRVRLLLTKAEKLGDVISIESELASREADLESVQRQQAALAGQASLSTITVALQGSVTGIPKPRPTPVAAPVARSGFLGGLANGWDAVRKIGRAVLQVIGTLIPFLPVVAVLLMAGLLWRRRLHRHTRPVLAPAGDPPVAE